jgi:hypothetical protein
LIFPEGVVGGGRLGVRGPHIPFSEVKLLACLLHSKASSLVVYHGWVLRREVGGSCESGGLCKILPVFLDIH